MFIPQPDQSTFLPPPSGTHVAICVRFIDLGTQQQEWKGTTKLYRKVLITWELPGELMDDGRPFTISKRYTWSMSEKANLRHDLHGWRGKAFTEADFTGPDRFDIKNILGKACLLTIVHDVKDGSTYANIQSVSALPKGMSAPAHTNPIVYFSLEADRFDADVLAGLSEKIQAVIKSSPEYGHRMNHEMQKPNGNGNGHEPPPVTGPDDYEDFGDQVPF